MHNEQLRKALKENIAWFQEDPATVGDHSLEGKMANLRAFYVNEDYRVVYLETADKYLFIDVGRHDQIYYR